MQNNFRSLRRTPLLALAGLALTAAQPGVAQPAGERAPRVHRQVVVESAESDEPVRVFFLGDEGHPTWIQPGRVERGYLGVGLLDLTTELRGFFGAPEDRGVLVSQVEAESPAAVAGLRVGDVVTSLDGEAVTSAARLTRRIGDHQEGDSIKIGIRRDRAESELTARLAERPRAQIDLGYAFRTCPPEEDCQGVVQNGAGPYRRVIPVAPEALNQALDELSRSIDSGEWRERMRRLRSGQEGYEERLQRLEERIRELEKQLDEAKDR